MTFTAIDFETATAHHICAVGIVAVENGVIVDEYHTLIQPPNNQYNWHSIRVHGITPETTAHAPNFASIYPEIKKRLLGKHVVAHNESFDRRVLRQTMEDFGIPYADLQVAGKWECTMKIYRAKGYKPATLNACSQREGIALKHHEALSDARACALLYIKS